MSVVDVVMLGVLGVLLAIQFKSGKPEYGIYVGIAVSLLIFFQICRYLESLKELLGEFTVMISGNTEYLKIIMKVTGTAYLSELGAGLCRDAGYQSVASQVELFGKVTILFSGMPVILSLMEMLTGFL